MNNNHRNSFFSLLLLICLSGVSFAQTKHTTTTDPRDGITYGIQGGLNASNIIDVNNNPFGDTQFAGKLKYGFNVGVFADIPIISLLHFQPEVNYSLKGYKAETESGGTFTRNYNFIDIPLLLKFYPVKHFHIYLGPQIGIKVSTFDTYTNTDANFIGRYERRDNDLRQACFGVTGGVGVDLSRHFLVNAGYVLDLSRSYKTAGYDTPGFKNQVFNLRIGYRF